MWRGGVRRDKESSSRRYASAAPFLSTHRRMPIGSPWQTVRGDGNLDFLLRRFTVGCDWHDGFGRKLPARSGLPIFDVQAAHAREFPGVVSHQDQASRPCLSGNQNVVRTDWCASRSEGCPDFACLPGILLVELQHHELQSIDPRQVLCPSLALVGTVEQLVSGNGRDPCRATAKLAGQRHVGLAVTPAPKVPIWKVGYFNVL